MKTNYTVTLIVATPEKLLMEIASGSFNSFREALEKCFSSNFFSNINILDDSLVIRVWIHQETFDIDDGVVGRCNFLVDTVNKTYKPEN